MERIKAGRMELAGIDENAPMINIGTVAGNGLVTTKPMRKNVAIANVTATGNTVAVLGSQVVNQNLISPNVTR